MVGVVGASIFTKLPNRASEILPVLCREFKRSREVYRVRYTYLNMTLGLQWLYEGSNAPASLYFSVPHLQISADDDPVAATVMFLEQAMWHN